jgi:hypothetical protein
MTSKENGALRSLTVQAVQQYLSEIELLAASVGSRIAEIQGAQQRWLEHEEGIAAQLVAPQQAFSEAAYSEGLLGKVNEQCQVFHALDGLLACWARLSLLLFPVQLKAKKQREMALWMNLRGSTLRELLSVPPDSLLSNRDIRDSWMHFDQRLDDAVQQGRLGNRQTICSSATAERAMEYSVRVIDMELLSLHSRAQDGVVQSIRLEDMNTCVHLLAQRVPGARGRAAEVVVRLWSTPRD